MEILQADEIKKECCDVETDSFSIWPLFKTEIKQEAWNQKHVALSSANCNQSGSFGVDTKLINSELGLECLQGQDDDTLNAEKLDGRERTRNAYSQEIVAQSQQNLYDVSFKKVEGNEVLAPWDVVQSQLMNHTPLSQIPIETCSSALPCNHKEYEKTFAEQKNYKCNCCCAEKNRFFKKSDYTATNTKQKGYISKIQTTCSSYLKSPNKTHTEDTHYRCNICDAAFTGSSDLLKHKIIHTQERPYKCEVCNATFAHSCRLLIHKRKHTGEKPYKCDFCEAAFRCSEYLVQHRRKHTGDKPYKCDMCPSAFTRSGNLVIHKRRHTGEKPYQCDMCEAVFYCSRYLITHKRKHTQERPYKCEVCNATFAQLSHVLIHKRKHTGKNHTNVTCVIQHLPGQTN